MIASFFLGAMLWRKNCLYGYLAQSTYYRHMTLLILSVLYMSSKLRKKKQKEFYFLSSIPIIKILEQLDTWWLHLIVNRCYYVILIVMIFFCDHYLLNEPTPLNSILHLLATSRWTIFSKWNSNSQFAIFDWQAQGQNRRHFRSEPKKRSKRIDLNRHEQKCVRSQRKFMSRTKVCSVLALSLPIILHKANFFCNYSAWFWMQNELFYTISRAKRILSTQANSMANVSTTNPNSETV